MKHEDYDEYCKIKNYDACVAKDRLMDMANWLEEHGYKRDAKSLGTIIGNLEKWQWTKVKE